MGLTLKNFYIPGKPYITKKLDHVTLSKLLDSSSFVVDGIYMIKEGFNRNISLFEEESIHGYGITGYVKVDYAYAGSARAQVKNIKPFRKLILRKPAYTLRINVYDSNQLIVYSFVQKYTRINRLIDSIDIQYQALDQFFSSLNLETK